MASKRNSGRKGYSSSRRNLYRRSKRLLVGLASRMWEGSRGGLETAVRRFLRTRSRGYLQHVVVDRRFATAVAGLLLAAQTAPGIPPVNLSDIAAGNGGFVINGIDPDDLSGFSVASARDVNGDGFHDIIVGAPRPNWAYYEPGESYVVFGKSDGTPVDLVDVVGGLGGFAIHGVGNAEYWDDRSGHSVSGVGDMNGDGLADVIVGAPNAGNLYAGEAYVVWGKAEGTPVYLSDVWFGDGGFLIDGAGTGNNLGASVSGAGDVNGDGVPDVIVGVPHGNLGPTCQCCTDDLFDSRRAFVVFGSADPLDGGSGGFTIRGITSGVAVSGAGDVNGDGRADLLAIMSGDSYVVFGKADESPVEYCDLSYGIGGFVILGSGSSSDAGDVNGDGLADIIVGRAGADPNGNTDAGESYVIFGKADTAAVDLTEIAAGNGGFVIKGIDTGDRSGAFVSGARDVNGDRLSDLIVGAPGADPAGNTDAGENYVVFGKADGTPVNLSAVAVGVGGFVINGVDPDDEASRVAAAGDVNGDGLADLLVGAPKGDPHGNTDAGKTYVVFSPVIRGDLDGDGLVSTIDILMLVGAWGPCPKPCPSFCTGDLDGNCMVSTSDLLILLGNWG